MDRQRLDYESTKPRPGSVRIIPAAPPERKTTVALLLGVFLICAAVVVYAWVRLAGA